jgi:dTDP-4-dehydrorhamnose reductase
VAAALDEANVVVHLAAFTNVDECELDRERAFKVNAQGTANVVAAAERSGARVVYVSTDYVFDGDKEGEYVEQDRTAPRNAYGASKLEGERVVLEAAGNLVVRTSWIFGRGRNFVDTIVGAGRAGNDLVVVDDQLGRPTWARDLARAIAYLIDSPETGVVHVAGDGGAASWADLADVALEAAGVAADVGRTDSASYERRVGRSLAPRPRNSTLSIEKARRLGVPLAPWRESVRSYVKESL